MEASMIIRKLIPVLALLLVLAACEKPNDHDDAPKLFEDQRAMMDKAKNMDNTLQQQADEQQKKLDQQSQ